MGDNGTAAGESRVGRSAAQVLSDRQAGRRGRSAGAGVAEVIAIETLSATPVEDKVAIALALIPHEGVKFIQAAEERIPVTAPESATRKLLR